MKKKTHEEFVLQLSTISPTIIVLGHYTNSHGHIEVQCSLCGKIWTPTPHDLLSGKGCKSCKMKAWAEKNKKSHDQFLKDLSQITAEIKVIGTYQTRHAPIKVQCLVCGNVWQTTPGDLLLGYGCKKCANKKNGINKRMNADTFYKKVAKHNPNIEFLESFYSASSRIHVRCTECGREWSPLAESLLQGAGCSNCKNKASGLARRKTHEQFELQISKLHPTLKLLEQYTCEANPIKVECQRCGRTWTASPSSLLQGTGCSRCSHASTSFMEQFLLHAFISILGENNVLSRDKSTIGQELDIVIPSIKVAIEPGSWVYHKNCIDKDQKKRQACTDIGYRLFTIYDSFPADEPTPFASDCITFPRDFGQSDHFHLQELVSQICKIIEIEDKLADVSWQQIEEAAYENSKSKSTKEFILEIAQKNPSIEILGQYKASREHINAKCKVCNHQWSPVAASLLNGEGCPICGRKTANKKLRKTHEQFVLDMTHKHPDLVVIGKYLNNKTPIEISCSICKHTWFTKPNTLLSGCGCPICGRKRAVKARSLQSKSLTPDAEKTRFEYK